jgi:hypothetical protein
VEMVARCAARVRIEAPLLSHFGRTALLRPGIVFGLAAFSEKHIRRAVRNLRRALHAPKFPGIVRRRLDTSSTTIHPPNELGSYERPSFRACVTNGELLQPAEANGFDVFLTGSRTQSMSRTFPREGSRLSLFCHSARNRRRAVHA